MHYLDRSQVPPPKCLSRYQHRLNNWNDLSPNDREEIRITLKAIQGARCAYCECDLNQHGHHIEHFYQRSHYPQRTFDWYNLFWSCERKDSCGKCKDESGIYKDSDLIKPDVDDPEKFFLFVADGSIALRHNLTTSEQHRARETLRIFNLDEQWGPLRRMRQAAASGYIKTAAEIEEIASLYPPQFWLPFLEDELEQTCDLPFCTTIKHVLTPQWHTA